MDDLAWLRLQIEWGADEALADEPIDRRTPLAPAAAPAGPPRAPSLVPPSAGGVARAQAAAEAADTVEALQAALSAFDGCALRTTAMNLVFADGDATARLMLIGDVPGAADDRSGRPFSGPGGLLLDRMFTSAGLDRGACRSTSLLPWRPPGDRKATDAEIQLCLPFLHRHLLLVAPRRVVLLGTVVARALLPQGGRRARSAWHAMAVPGLPDPIPALALPAVTHIQAAGSAKRDAWMGLLQLRRALDADKDGRHD